MSAKTMKNGKRALRALGLTMTLLAAALVMPSGASAATGAPTDGGTTDALADVIGTANVLAEHQARDLGFEVVVGPALQGFTTPSEAVAGLLARFDVTPSPQQAEAIASLDALPAPKREALAGVIDAYLAFEEATSLAYANVDIEAAGAALAQSDAAAELLKSAPLDADSETLAAWEREHLPATGATKLGELGLDFSQVFGARARMLDATVTFARVFAPAEPGTNAALPPLLLTMAPALILDLNGLGDTHTVDVALSIDAGGSDIYNNNAGGVSRLLPGTAYNWCPENHPFAAAALIDLAGDDLRTGPRNCGTNGGGAFGAGFSFDLIGADTYSGVSLGVNGGALFGSGFLLDVAGKDTYAGQNGGVNGGANLGAGFLVDAAGDDAYTGYYSAVNGGAWGLAFNTTNINIANPGVIAWAGVASGVLVDLAGNDRYTAASYGVNGGGIANGAGKLIDVDGDDEYFADSGGTNGGGYVSGTGLLVDVAGADTYVTRQGGTNGGGRHGVGTLLDLAGDDAYTGTTIQTNGGALNGVGLLVDVAGNDTYRAQDVDVNGGATSDCYVPDPIGYVGPLGSTPVNKCYATSLTLALLVDLGGTDNYYDVEGFGGIDRSVVFKGFVGAQLDTCLAEAPGFGAPLDITTGTDVIVKLMGAKVQACAPKMQWGGTPPIVARVPDGTFSDACAAPLSSPTLPDPAPWVPSLPSSPCHTSIDLVKILFPRPNPNNPNQQCLAEQNFCLGVPIGTALPPACEVLAVVCIPADTLDDRTLASVPQTPGFPVTSQPTEVGVEVEPVVVDVTPHLGERETIYPSIPTLLFGDIDGEFEILKSPEIKVDGAVIVNGSRFEVPIEV